MSCPAEPSATNRSAASEEDLDAIAARADPRRAACRQGSASKSGPNRCTSSGSAGTSSAPNCSPGGWPDPASASSWTSAISWPPARSPLEYLGAMRGGSPTSTCATPSRGTSTSASATATRTFAAGLRGLAAAGLHRPFLARTRNPGRHPRGTPGRGRQGRQLHHRPPLTIDCSITALMSPQNGSYGATDPSKSHTTPTQGAS